MPNFDALAPAYSGKVFSTVLNLSTFAKINNTGVMMKRTVFLLFFVFCSLLSGQQAFGQQFAGEEESDFRWRLTGRVFFDGGVFTRDSVATGFQVNDLRLGTVIRFLDDWEAKLEFAYEDSKVSLKDVFLSYTRGDHLFRLGHYFEPFGNARVGTANFRFMTNAVADKVLGDKRKLGVTYAYNRERINVVGGVFSDGDIGQPESLNQGYILAAKFVGRPLMRPEKLIHIGVAPRFSKNGGEVHFSGGAPTDLLDKKENTILEARVDRVINQWKLDLEVILLYNKWYAQGQFFLSHLNRFAALNYDARGGYVQAGYMILGAEHNYNPVTGMIVNPAPGSLEALVRYDNTDLNDAGITGGRMSDISLGVNYFMSKFMAVKINYTRMMPGETAVGGAEDFDVIQGRIQFSF